MNPALNIHASETFNKKVIAYDEHDEVRCEAYPTDAAELEEMVDDLMRFYPRVETINRDSTSLSPREGRGEAEPEALFTEEDEIAAQLEAANKPGIKEQIEFLDNRIHHMKIIVQECDEDVVHKWQRDLQILFAIKENLIAVRLYEHTSPERTIALAKQDPLI